MQETTNTIIMLGETMEVFVGAGCLSDCRPGTAVRLPGIITNLCKTLTKRSVSKTFMNHIRIGDTVALIDKKAGCTFRLQVNAHSICVLGIRYNTVPPKNTAQVFYLANTRLLQQIPSGRWAVAAA